MTTILRGTAHTASYYNNLKREEIYRTALDRYTHDQLARPIVNMIVNAVFSEPPDFQGDKPLVDKANQIIKNSEVDWSTWGADLEVHGDVFLRGFKGRNSKIASLPAQSISIDYDEDNILNIRRYIQHLNRQDQRSIPPEQISHIKINNTSNMVYGMSTLRPVFWWLDVLDNLWERNWIRAAQYYGAPIVAITGVPGEHQKSVSSSLEPAGHRPGRDGIFPEGVSVETLDFARNYPIEELIDRVYQYILAACNIPQHLIYESDSSRGVAMFSGDAFEMMIKLRRRTWELGLLRVINYLFDTEGIPKETRNLKIRWAPVFSRDLKSLAQLIEVGMTHKLCARRSARERLMLDRSEELESLKKQKEEEPDEPEPPEVPP